MIKTLFFKPLQMVGNHFLIISTILVLYFGWMQRGENYITAEEGVGYALGITGGSLMMVLLLYPISKRVKLFTKWIPIRYWFGIHMTFGVIGPVMIMFHSNFHLGSINSSVALVCMVLVAGSGLIGRYIYTHIHHGLYGSRITIKELQQKTDDNHSALLKLYSKDDELNLRLKKMEEKVLQPYTNLLSSLSHVIYLGLSAYGLRMKVIRLVLNEEEDQLKDKDIAEETPDRKKLYASVNRYTLALRELAAHRVYERLFSLWHVLHLPLFYMMIITAVIHIYAVHVY